MTPNANAGYQFANWTGSLTGISSPQTVVMSSPAGITANFIAVTAVTVATNPPGLTIAVDGVTVTAPQTFSWPPGTTHIIGILTPQGSGSTQYVFAGWNDGGDQSHTITTPNSPVTYVATFTTIVTTGTASADSISPGSGSGSIQTFAIQYSDTAGATNLSSVWIWFTANFSGANFSRSNLAGLDVPGDRGDVLARHPGYP
jgi:hypothetical protein